MGATSCASFSLAQCLLRPGLARLILSLAPHRFLRPCSGMQKSAQRKCNYRGDHNTKRCRVEWLNACISLLA